LGGLAPFRGLALFVGGIKEMTEATTPSPDAEFLSISAMAERLGLSVQAVSQRVAKLEALGLLTTTRGKGRVRFVSFTDYMRAISQTGDQAREAGWRTRKRRNGETPDEGGTYLESQTRKIRLDAEFRALQVGKLKGELVPIRSVETSLSVAAARIVRVLDRLPTRTDEIISCVTDHSANPVPRVRALLKQVVRDIRTEMAAAMADVTAIGAGAEAAGTVSFDIELDDADDQPEIMTGTDSNP
jgi:DNA-binding MarR family transcriptional regulator